MGFIQRPHSRQYSGLQFVFFYYFTQGFSKPSLFYDKLPKQHIDQPKTYPNPHTILFEGKTRIQSDRKWNPKQFIDK